MLFLQPSLIVHLGLAPFFSLRPSHSVSPSVSLLIRLSLFLSINLTWSQPAKGSVHAAACGGPALVRSPATPPAPAKAVRPAAPPPPPPAERKPRPAPIECALPLLADALGGIDSGDGPAVARAVLPQGARQRGPRRRRCHSVSMGSPAPSLCHGVRLSYLSVGARRLARRLRKGQLNNRNFLSHELGIPHSWPCRRCPSLRNGPSNVEKWSVFIPHKEMGSPRDSLDHPWTSQPDA